MENYGFKNWATREVCLLLLNTEADYLATKHFTRPAQYKEYCEEVWDRKKFTEKEWEEIDWYEVYEGMTEDEE